MARIRKDHTNWGGDKAYKELKGDFPEEPKHRSKRKDTKKWCKGIEGRLHDLEKALDYEFLGLTKYCLRCKKCNKKIHSWDKEYKDWIKENE